MVTSVLIEDYSTSSANYVIIGQDDLEEVENIWFEEDSLLMGLQNTKAFDGRRTLSDLKPWHFHFLIANNLEAIFELKKEDRDDPNHPAVTSLDVLISAFVYCIKDYGSARVEFIKIQRVEPMVVNFDYHASVMLELTYHDKESKPGLSVVVDNTKADGGSGTHFKET